MCLPVTVSVAVRDSQEDEQEDQQEEDGSEHAVHHRRGDGDAHGAQTPHVPPLQLPTTRTLGLLELSTNLRKDSQCPEKAPNRAICLVLGQQIFLKPPFEKVR